MWGKPRHYTVSDLVAHRYLCGAPGEHALINPMTPVSAQARAESQFDHHRAHIALCHAFGVPVAWTLALMHALPGRGTAGFLGTGARDLRCARTLLADRARMEQFLQSTHLAHTGRMPRSGVPMIATGALHAQLGIDHLRAAAGRIDDVLFAHLGVLAGQTIPHRVALEHGYPKAHSPHYRIAA